MRILPAILLTLAIVVISDSYKTALAQSGAHRDNVPLEIIYAGALFQPGLPVSHEQTIMVRGKYIESIQAGYVNPSTPGENAAQVIDLRDSFVMPGLIDTHVHLTTTNLESTLMQPVSATDADLAVLATVNAKKILDAGFTTVMDMGTGRRAHERAVYAVRDAIARGEIPGPEVLAAGSPISATGLSRTGLFRDNVEQAVGPEGVCDSPNSCRYAVREQVKRGADFINVFNTGSLLSEPSVPQSFTDAELHAIVETAQLLHRVVVADGGNSPKSAAGVDQAIEAGFQIVDTVTYPDARTFALVKEHHVFFSPHLYALQAAVGDTPDTLQQGSMGWLPPSILQKLYALKNATPSALAAYKDGTKLILGSDSGVFPHGENGHELVAYVKLGISPADTLAAATLNAAEAHGISDRTGSIKAGKEADIIAMKKSPLVNMTAILDVSFVMSDGRVEVWKKSDAADQSPTK
jgi:imidazolonepropionase-like amidohydrolase